MFEESVCWYIHQTISESDSKVSKTKSCKTCQQSFQSGIELRNHEKIHDNEDFQLQQKTQPPDMMMKMMEDIMQRLAALEKAISSK